MLKGVLGKRKLELHWQIVIAMVLSVVVGIFAKDAVPYLSWTGDIFLRALKMVVIPLIMSSIISAIVNIGGGESFGRLGLKTMAYYMVTSLLAIVTSLFFINILKPGVGALGETIDMSNMVRPETKSLSDTIIGIVPSNIFSSLSSGDFLPIIFFSIVVGVFAVKLKDEGDKGIIKSVANASFNLFMKITMFVVSLAPIGVFGLIVKVVADQEDIAATAKALGLFFITVSLGLLVHALFTVPMILRFFSKVNPWRHMSNMKTMIITAFSTASSAAALPLNMKDTTEKSGVSEKITGFTLPIGATVNMDGTAIYICGVVLFIAQVQGIEVNFESQVLIVLTALLASIGTAAVPMGSLVIISILLDTLDLPYEMVALILPVDRVLDMIRTSVNVWSDSCGAVLIAKSEGETLPIDL